MNERLMIAKDIFCSDKASDIERALYLADKLIAAEKATRPMEDGINTIGQMREQERSEGAQPRTVEQVMREALTEEEYQKWLANKPKIELGSITEQKASNMLSAYFTWCATNEGHEFWGRLFLKLESQGK
jgi:hypothetical protein